MRFVHALIRDTLYDDLTAGRVSSCTGAPEARSRPSTPTTPIPISQSSPITSSSPRALRTRARRSTTRGGLPPAP